MPSTGSAHFNNFFKGLPKNLLQSFRGRFLAFHFAAIILTYALVVSGWDWLYFQSTRNPALQSFLFPAALIGGLLPILVPWGLYVLGALQKQTRRLNTAFALGQAGMAAWLVSSTYKAFTGRVPPAFRQALVTQDISQGFQFGWMRGGIFWGWPSTHTTVAFAMSVALMVLYPENKKLRYAAALYAFYIGIGISTNIHWLSDFVAGALVGTAIGLVVGRGFRKTASR